MSIINNVLDIGDMMVYMDESYDDETGKLDSVLTEGVDDLDDSDDIEIDVDIQADSLDDIGTMDELDIADHELDALKQAREDGMETSVDDDVMDLYLQDELDDMDLEELEEYAFECEKEMESFVEVF